MVNSVSNSSYDRTAMTSQMAQKMFKKIDSNSDGGIDKAELEAIAGSSSTTDISQLFSKLDTNSDGKIDQSENESALQKLAQKMESAFSKMQGTGGMQKPPPPDSSEMFNKLDTDKNGGVSEDEFNAIAKNKGGQGPQFSDIDADGDGSISETENEDFMKSMGPPPGPPPGGMGGMGQMGGMQGASESDSFTDLLSALESAVSDDEEDETTSSIQQLFNELKSNIKYSAQGSKSYSMSGTESLFSITA